MARMRALAVVLLLAVASVQAWLAFRGGQARPVALLATVVVVAAAAFVGWPRRAAGLL